MTVYDNHNMQPQLYLCLLAALALTLAPAFVTDAPFLGVLGETGLSLAAGSGLVPSSQSTDRSHKQTRTHKHKQKHVSKQERQHGMNKVGKHSSTVRSML
jgi:hypothetical protein